MKVKILGTRGEIGPSAPYHSRHSGVLIGGELMLDLGEEEFLGYGPKAIFLTHLHPDHAFFARNGVEFEESINPPLYGPEKYEKNKVKVKKFLGEKQVGYSQITAIPTIHSKRVVSQAYLVEKDEKRLLYTGDMIWIEKENHSHLNGTIRDSKSLDAVIAEASFLKKGGMVRRDAKTDQAYGHNGVPNLVRFFSQFTDNIVFTHFGSWFYKMGAKAARKKIESLGKSEGIRAFAAYDGMEFEV
jgi:ribonuclease BN (tRNA processing enzyme)